MSKRRPMLLLACLGLMGRLPAAATWTAIGPDLSSVRALAVTPAGVVYAGTTQRSIFRSDDGGARWTAADSQPALVAVRDLAVDPGHPQRLYVLTDRGLYRTAAGTLRNVSPGQPPSLSGSIDAFAVAPSDPARLYVMDDVDVLTSHDQGATWQRIETNLAGGASIVRVDPRDAGVLYIGSGTGVLKSLDGGRTWHGGTLGLAGPRGVRSLALDPQQPDVQYAGTTGNGIWKSVDGGESWTQALVPPFGIDRSVVTALAVDPAETRRVFAAVDRLGGGNLTPSGEVWRSEDAGASWMRVIAGTTAILSLAIDPSDPRRIYAGFEQEGVLASADHGGSWQPARHGLQAYTVHGITVDPRNPDSLWIAAGEVGSLFGAYPGLFHTVDGGASWVSSSQGVVQDIVIQTIVLDPVRPERLFAIAGSFLFRSLDGGRSWQGLSLASAICRSYCFAIDALAVDPSGVDRIYIAGKSVSADGGNRAGLWRSEDGGDSWEDLGAGFVTGQPGGLGTGRVDALAIHPDRAETLFAHVLDVSGNRLFRSRNAGRRWLPVEAPGECTLGTTARIGTDPLLIDPFVTSTMYTFGCQVDHPVAKSIDRGAHWQPTAFGGDVRALTSLAADLGRPGTLYVGGAGVLSVTVDSGASWHSLTVGLPTGPVVLALASDPHTPGRLYAGLQTAGLFALTQPP